MNTLFESDSPIILNIGCGSSHVSTTKPFFNQWKEIRADLYEPDVDLRCDIVHMGEIPNESVDCVWASHVLEHQYWHEIPIVLNNIMRVLKSSGFAVIKVPDLGYIADKIKNSLLEPMPHYYGLAPIDLLYGMRERVEQDGIGEVHKTGFTVESMTKILTHFEISAFISDANYEITAVCYKDKSPQDILNNL